MTVFGEYAAYYDLLYRDKNYTAEAEYVVERLSLEGAGIASLLELGCGTGRHAAALVAQGIDVVAVDRSLEMIIRARARHSDTNCPARFLVSDIRDVALSQRFDAVVSLFHSMGYMSRDSDLSSALASARRHLHRGGFFLFDFWHGPAVLTTPPEVRVRRLREGDLEILRVAEPTVYPEENCVEVSYNIRAVNLLTSSSISVVESHRVRYFFLPELGDLLLGAGFDMVAAYEWLTNSAPSRDSWNVCVVARAA
jgi:SAM-dependent methyltransferase